jgi:hypothetical protein
MRPPPALLLVVLAFVSFFSLSGIAGPDCAPAPAATITGDLQKAAATQPTAQKAWSLPAGTVGAADLSRAFDFLKKDGKGIAGFFAMLADGQRRVLPGDVVRDIFGKNHVTLDFLPIDALREVVAEEGKVTFTFDFGGDKTRDLRLPDTKTKVLDSRTESDPTAADGRNRVKEIESDGRKLRIKSELQFSVDGQGITGVREDDIRVKALLWFSLALHTETIPGHAATADGKPVVATDAKGDPVVKDGHYVIQNYDDWVILEAGGKRIEVGVPKP